MDRHATREGQEKILHVKIPLGTYRRLRHEAIERGLTNTQLIIAVFAEPENFHPSQAKPQG